MSGRGGHQQGGDNEQPFHESLLERVRDEAGCVNLP
jgi:hypothetical protein